MKLSRSVAFKAAPLLVLILLPAVYCIAQPANPDPPVNEHHSSLEESLSTYVLIFGFLIILLEVYLIRVSNIDPANIIKFIIVTLIITATLFLITAGYSSVQIAPATGLLGTIAGYLLGKSDRKHDAV